MVFPTINLNGTSSDSLCEALYGANNALAASFTALNKTAPHARDYPNEVDYAKAVKEHLSRLQRLLDIQTEIIQTYDNITEQEDARQAKQGQALTGF